MARAWFGAFLLASSWAFAAHAERHFTTIETAHGPFEIRTSADAADANRRIATPSIVYRHMRAVYEGNPEVPVAVAPGADNVWAEDVHLATGGYLRRLLFGYYMTGREASGVHAKIWVYENDANDTRAPSQLLMGPIEFNIAPSIHVQSYTARVFNFNSDLALVGKDLWIAVSFDHDNPGLVLVDGDAQVGQTHNLYYDFSTQQTAQLPEGRAANFVAEIRVDPVPTAVRGLTWSGVKALFASSFGTRPSASR